MITFAEVFGPGRLFLGVTLVTGVSTYKLYIFFFFVKINNNSLAILNYFNCFSFNFRGSTYIKFQTNKL